MRTTIPAIPAVDEVRDSNNNVVTAAVPAVPPVLPIIMPAKSTHRLEVASIAWHYYTDTTCAITTGNMHYTNVLQAFYTKWKAIVSMANETPPDVPCITKNNPPLKWTDTFMDYCNNIIIKTILSNMLIYEPSCRGMQIVITLICCFIQRMSTSPP